MILPGFYHKSPAGLKRLLLLGASIHAFYNRDAM